LDSGVLADQQLNERTKQRLRAFGDSDIPQVTPL
jgi:hypothetical protein